MKRKAIFYALAFVVIGLVIIAMFTFAPFVPKTRYAKAINLTKAVFGWSDRGDAHKWFESELQRIPEKTSKTTSP